MEKKNITLKPANIRTTIQLSQIFHVTLMVALGATTLTCVFRTVIQSETPLYTLSSLWYFDLSLWKWCKINKLDDLS